MTEVDQSPVCANRTRSVSRAATLPVTVRETHSAYVFLLDTIAYKMKKSVITEFLDFSSLDNRWTALDREYTLNARFAPDVYLGIAELSDPTGGPAEPLLKMRRLPDLDKLSELARSGADLRQHLSEIAQIVASVHSFSPHRDEIDHAGSSEALLGRWAANISELRVLSPGIIDSRIVDAIDTHAVRFVKGRGTLLDRRIESGRVVDGHGDLLADDIFCLPDGPRILDCLDFDEALRFVDGIDDAACLAMDLEYNGRPDAARFFLSAYLTAAQDSPPPCLVDHYIAYRAVVRAKVACIRALQGHEQSEAEAYDHAKLALAHLEASTMTLTLIGGLPGTGKSTLAQSLACETDAVVLSSDIVRKELAGLDPLDSHPAPVEEGLYTPSMTDRTYAELLCRSRSELAAGRSVIMDASWSDPGLREQARLLASSSYANLVELECTAPESTCIHRIETRPATASDATREVYEAMVRVRAAWPTATSVDCSTTIANAVEAAHARWAAALRS